MDLIKPKIILITGPTATGKSSLSINLAQEFKLPIINCDSLLFYKELSIGVAKPTPEERKQIPHYLIDIASISHPLNASDYTLLAHPLIKKLSCEFPAILVVGGSGFYLQALCNGMYPSNTSSSDIKMKSDNIYLEQGIQPFLEILQKNDPISFELYHHNDHYRIRRAVEHWWMNHFPFSRAREQLNNCQPYWKNENWQLHHMYFDISKENHQDVIKKRTQQMLKSGLIDEVSNLLKSGFSGFEKPLQSIGYKEVIQYLNQEIKSLNELEEKINIATRQLAKAQRTWFKKHQKITYNPLEDYCKLSSNIQKILAQQN